MCLARTRLHALIDRYWYGTSTWTHLASDWCAIALNVLPQQASTKLLHSCSCLFMTKALNMWLIQFCSYLQHINLLRTINFKLIVTIDMLDLFATYHHITLPSMATNANQMIQPHISDTSSRTLAGLPRELKPIQNTIRPLTDRTSANRVCTLLYPRLHPCELAPGVKGPAATSWFIHRWSWIWLIS